MNVPKDIEKLVTFILLVLLVLIIYSIVIFASKSKEGCYKDILNETYIDAPLFGETSLAWWSVSHFTLFAILGFYFPNRFAYILAIGVIFEAIEEMIRQSRLLPAGGDTERKGQYEGEWIRGTFSDIIIDVAGFFVGYNVAKFTHHYRKKSSTNKHLKSKK